MLEDVEAMSQLLIFDKQLSLWRSDLPKWLRSFFDGHYIDNDWDPQHIRQARVVCLRYHNSIIMLHRPYLLREMLRLSRGLSIFTETALSLVQNSVRACLNSATEIIKLISDVNTPEELGAWWYVVHYLHSAAILLFSGAFFPFQLLFEEGKIYHSHLSQAIELLQKLSVGNDTVSQYQQFLRRLVTKAHKQQVQTNGARAAADCGNVPDSFSHLLAAMTPDLQNAAICDRENRDEWLTDLSLEGLLTDLPIF